MTDRLEIPLAKIRAIISTIPTKQSELKMALLDVVAEIESKAKIPAPDTHGGASPVADGGKPAANQIALLAAKLGRPVAIFDLETTGLIGPNPVGIVEYAIRTVGMDGSEPKSVCSRVNPEMPIPWQAWKVHGIGSKLVAGKPPYPAIHANFMGAFSASVICGFNINEYDIAVIRENAERYGLPFSPPAMSLDIRDVWREVSGSRRGTLAAVAKHYDVTPGQAHAAMGDVHTCAAILEAMVSRHGVDFLSRFVRQPKMAEHEAAPPKSKLEDLVFGAVTPLPQEVVATAPPAPRVPGATKTTQRREVISLILSRFRRDGECMEMGTKGLERLLQLAQEERPDLEFTDIHVSFALGEEIAIGSISAQEIAHANTQDLIAQHIEQAREMVQGDVRLKPTKDALEKLAGVSIDYVQIKAFYTLEDERRDAEARSMDESEDEPAQHCRPH